jgi:hypothetical protein
MTQECYSLHSVKVSCESVSADVQIAEVLETPNKLIGEENYLTEHICYMNETSLF